MARRLEGIAHLIAVASGKGGVGKTTVTANLALALADAGWRTGIFDADMYGPNVPLMFGIRRSESAPGLLPIMRVQQEPYIPPVERFGIKLMSMGLLVGEHDALMPDPHDTGRIVTQTMADVRWGELDVLLVDLPPGTGEPQQSLLRAFVIDGAVLVSTPQDLAMLDVGRSLSMFQQHATVVLGLVENMSYAVCPRCGEQIEIFARSNRQWHIDSEAPELLGRLPMTPAMSRTIDRNHPLVRGQEETAEATTFRQIARRIMEKLDVASE